MAVIGDLMEAIWTLNLLDDLSIFQEYVDTHLRLSECYRVGKKASS